VYNKEEGQRNLASDGIAANCQIVETLLWL